MANINKSIFVVGIHIGISHSGYAFACKSDYACDPPKFITSSWPRRGGLSLKAPTVVLLNKYKELVAFGYEAEQKYAKIIEDNEQDDYYYFYHFKKLQYNQRITSETKIHDVTHKWLPAITVFSLTIRYLIEHVQRQIQKNLRLYSNGEEDYYFVLTIPEINVSSMHTIREAAYLAGVKKGQIEIGLHYEAISLYYKRLECIKFGMKYIIIDFGDETTVISVCKMDFGGIVQKVMPSILTSWGEKSVDKAFSEFLSELFGLEVMEEFKEKEPGDYNDLFREFEMKKRTIRSDQINDISVTLPVSLTYIIKWKFESLEKVMKESSYGSTVYYSNQKLHIAAKVFRLLFTQTIDNVLLRIKKLLEDSKLSTITTILMIGRFSECKLIQDAIKKLVGHTRNVVISEDAEVIDLKGAVAFGFSETRYGIVEPPLGTSLFVVGIDFGTTYSGYAFASRHDFTLDPPKVRTANWEGNKLMSMKAPTAVLLNNKQELVKFGYEAENEFSEILADKRQDDFYYFHQFKMLLHMQRVTRETKIKDATGKSMEAIKVFSLVIQFLKQDFLKKIQKTVTTPLKEYDFYFVLTVPAIWNDLAKQFMRKAAEMAGIDKDKLAIAIEPEVASLFCQTLKTEREGTEFIETVKSGMKYMVIDLGGGTADITVHQMHFDGSISEVIAPTGGPLGGKFVDDAFYQFLCEICDEKVLEDLKSHELEDYLDLFREFETKKRKITTNQTHNVVITLPVSLTDLMMIKFEKALENSRYQKEVTFGKQKLHISPAVFRGFFKHTISELTKLLETLLGDKKLSDLETILLVGGFSECELVQDAVKNKIGTSRKLIIPVEAGLAVLKGAVLFGHEPKIGKFPRLIRCITRYTYGVRLYPDLEIHSPPTAKPVECKTTFFKYITKGEIIMIGQEFVKEFKVLRPEKAALECSVYYSTELNPQHIDDPGCQRLGNLFIQLPQNTDLTIELALIYGKNEIIFRARGLQSGIISEVQFNFR